jgi:hypothetical protein
MPTRKPEQAETTGESVAKSWPLLGRYDSVRQDFARRHRAHEGKNREPS